MNWTINKNSRRRVGWWYPWNLIAGLFRFVFLPPSKSYRLYVGVTFDSSCLYKLPTNPGQVNKLIRWGSTTNWLAIVLYLLLVGVGAIFLPDLTFIIVGLVLAIPLWIALDDRDTFGFGWTGDEVNGKISLYWIAEKGGTKKDLRSLGRNSPRMGFGDYTLGQYGVWLADLVPGQRYLIQVILSGTDTVVVKVFEAQTSALNTVSRTPVLMPTRRFINRTMLPYFGGGMKAPKRVNGEVSWSFSKV